MDAKIMEARCPECGSPDIDFSYSLDPIKDGCKCFDCGHIYMLGQDTGVEIGQEGLEERMKTPGWFSWTENYRDMLRRRFGRS